MTRTSRGSARRRSRERRPDEGDDSRCALASRGAIAHGAILPGSGSSMRLVVTGTDTGVGKTYVSAALSRPGSAYVKAAQTGDDDDAATVRELSGAEVHTLARYPEPLSPERSAARAGVPCITP